MTVHLYPTMSKNAEYAAYIGRISDLSSLGSHEAALLIFWPISNGYYTVVFIVVNKKIFPMSV